MIYGSLPNEKPRQRSLFFFRKITAVFVLFVFSLFDISRYAPQVYANPVAAEADPAPSSFSIPGEFGKIDEVYFGTRDTGHGTRGPDEGGRSPWPVERGTVVFIQDAHDSLEAQENIAKIIGHLTARYGIRTVFEEGYEGPVPTDRFFGFIKDPAVREKVSYLLLDKLRIGGAEYAHITRDSYFAPRDSQKPVMQIKEQGRVPSPESRGTAADWQLIGVEDLGLYRDNILQYQRSSRHQKETEEDVAQLFARITALGDRHFPEPLKVLLKRQERFHSGKLPLLDYLRDLRELYLKGGEPHPAERFSSSYPALSILLMARAFRDPSLTERLNALDFSTVFKEKEKLEHELASLFLSHGRDREIFGYYQGLKLIARLNRIEVTPAEYEAVKATLQTFKTQNLADFIARETRKPVVLSKGWERHIQDPARFYEVALQREGSISRTMDQFFLADSVEGTGDRKSSIQEKLAPNPYPLNPNTRTAILVYGGFHANSIKEMLRAKGISYVAVSPRITSPDKKHREYYQRMMTADHYGFDPVFLPARANRPPSDFFAATQIGDAALDRKLRALASSVEVLGGKPAPGKAEPLSVESGDRSVRSEARGGGEQMTSSLAAKLRGAPALAEDKALGRVVDIGKALPKMDLTVHEMRQLSRSIYRLFYGVNDMDPAWLDKLLADLKNFEKAGDKVYLLIDPDGEITGYYQCVVDKGDTGKLWLSYVMVQHAGTGRGTFLADTAMKDLKALGFRSLYFTAAKWSLAFLFHFLSPRVAYEADLGSRTRFTVDLTTYGTLETERFRAQADFLRKINARERQVAEVLGQISRGSGVYRLKSDKGDPVVFTFHIRDGEWNASGPSVPIFNRKLGTDLKEDHVRPSLSYFGGELIQVLPDGREEVLLPASHITFPPLSTTGRSEARNEANPPGGAINGLFERSEEWYAMHRVGFGAIRSGNMRKPVAMEDIFVDTETYREVTEALKDGKNSWISVVGEAGIGKTMTLARIFGDRGPGNSIVIDPYTMREQEILGALDQVSDYAREHPEAAGRLTVFIDTLDHAISMQGSPGEITRRILRLTGRGIRVVTFCRSGEWDRLEKESSEIGTLPALRIHATGFGDKTILEKAVRRYVEAYYPGSAGMDQGKREAMVQSLLKNDLFAVLARNPLYMAMAFSVYAPEQVPLNIDAKRLYDEFWKKKVTETRLKSGNGKLRNDSLGLAKKRTAMFLAWVMMQKGVLEIDQDTLAREFAQELQSIGMLPERVSWEEAVDDLVSEGVLARVERKIRFFHQTFFEYTAAKVLLGYDKDEDREAALNKIFASERLHAFLPVLIQTGVAASPSVRLQLMKRLAEHPDFLVQCAAIDLYVALLVGEARMHDDEKKIVELLVAGNWLFTNHLMTQLNLQKMTQDGRANLDRAAETALTSRRHSIKPDLSHLEDSYSLERFEMLAAAMKFKARDIKHAGDFSMKHLRILPVPGAEPYKEHIYASDSYAASLIRFLAIVCHHGYVPGPELSHLLSEHSYYLGGVTDKDLSEVVSGALKTTSPENFGRQLMDKFEAGYWDVLRLLIPAMRNGYRDTKRIIKALQEDREHMDLISSELDNPNEFDLVEEIIKILVTDCDSDDYLALIDYYLFISEFDEYRALKGLELIISSSGFRFASKEASVRVNDFISSVLRCWNPASPVEKPLVFKNIRSLYKTGHLEFDGLIEEMRQRLRSKRVVDQAVAFQILGILVELNRPKVFDFVQEVFEAVPRDDLMGLSMVELSEIRDRVFRFFSPGAVDYLMKSDTGGIYMHKAGTKMIEQYRDAFARLVRVVKSHLSLGIPPAGSKYLNFPPLPFALDEQQRLNKADDLGAAALQVCNGYANLMKADEAAFSGSMERFREALAVKPDYLATGYNLWTVVNFYLLRAAIRIASLPPEEQHVALGELMRSPSLYQGMVKTSALAPAQFHDLIKKLSATSYVRGIAAGTEKEVAVFKIEKGLFDDLQKAIAGYLKDFVEKHGNADPAQIDFVQSSLGRGTFLYDLWKEAETQPKAGYIVHYGADLKRRLVLVPFQQRKDNGFVIRHLEILGAFNGPVLLAQDSEDLGHVAVRKKDRYDEILKDKKSERLVSHAGTYAVANKRDGISGPSIDTLELDRALHAFVYDDPEVQDRTRNALELGVGTGFLLTSLATHLEHVEVLTGNDTEQTALDTTLQNVARAISRRKEKGKNDEDGAPKPDLKRTILEGEGRHDSLDEILEEARTGKRYQVAIVNPPYLPMPAESDEPGTSTYYGDHSLSFMKKILAHAHDFLSQDGILLMLYSNVGQDLVEKFIGENKSLRVEYLNPEDDKRVPFTVKEVIDNPVKLEFLKKRGLESDITHKSHPYWHRLRIVAVYREDHPLFEKNGTVFNRPHEWPGNNSASGKLRSEARVGGDTWISDFQEAVEATTGLTRLVELAANDFYWVRIAALSRLARMKPKEVFAALRKGDPVQEELRTILKAYHHVKPRKILETVEARERKMKSFRQRKPSPSEKAIRARMRRSVMRAVKEREDLLGSHYALIARWDDRDTAMKENILEFTRKVNRRQWVRSIVIWQFIADMARFAKRTDGIRGTPWRDITDHALTESKMQEFGPEFEKAKKAVARLKSREVNTDDREEERDRIWLKVASRVARDEKFRAQTKGLETGAVVVSRDGEVIGIGYNGAPWEQKDDLVVVGDDTRMDDFMQNDKRFTKRFRNLRYALDIRDDRPDLRRSICAEQRAILFAILSGKNLEGATLYATHSPCNQCLVTAFNARIRRIRCSKDFHDQNSQRILDKLPKAHAINWKEWPLPPRKKPSAEGPVTVQRIRDKVRRIARRLQAATQGRPFSKESSADRADAMEDLDSFLKKIPVEGRHRLDKAVRILEADHDKALSRSVARSKKAMPGSRTLPLFYERLIPMLDNRVAQLEDIAMKQHLSGLTGLEVRDVERLLKEYGLGNLIEVGSKAHLNDKRIPKIRTDKGWFAIKKIYALEPEDKDKQIRFFGEVFHKFYRAGVPVAWVYRFGKQSPENLFFVSRSLQDGSPSYFMVERWIEAGSVRREDATPAMLKEAARRLADIHLTVRDVRQEDWKDLKRWVRDDQLNEMEESARNHREDIRRHYGPDDAALILDILDRELPAVREALRGVPLTPVQSDLNFANIFFDEKGEKIQAIIDWDNLRFGYRIEDFVAPLIRYGRKKGGYHTENMVRELVLILKAYQGRAGSYALSDGEIDALPAFVVLDLLGSIFIQDAKRVLGSGNEMDPKRRAFFIKTIREVRKQFGPYLRGDKRLSDEVLRSEAQDLAETDPNAEDFARRYQDRYQKELTKPSRELRYQAVYDLFAGLFGIEENDDTRRLQKGKELLGKIYAAPGKEGLIETALRSADHYAFVASSAQRFYPLMIAIRNALEGRPLFAPEAIATLPPTPEGEANRNYLLERYPFYDGDGAGESIPLVRLKRGLSSSGGKLRVLDIGCAPKTHGSMPLNHLRSVLGSWGIASEIHGTDIFFPVLSLKDGEAVESSPYDFGPEGSAELGGVRYWDGIRDPKADILSDAFTLGKFDLITLSKMLHHLELSGETREPKPLSTRPLFYDKRGRDLGPYKESYRITRTQQKVIDRLLGSLNVGGVLFLNLTYAFRRSGDNIEDWKAAMSEAELEKANSDTFIVIQREAENAFRIYDEVVPFRSEDDRFESLEKAFFDPRPAETWVCRQNLPAPAGSAHRNIFSILREHGTRDAGLLREAGEIFSVADRLAYRAQRLNQAVWGQIFKAIEVRDRGGSVEAVLSKYLENVPESPEKRELLSRAAVLDARLGSARSETRVKIKDGFFVPGAKDARTVNVAIYPAGNAAPYGMQYREYFGRVYGDVQDFLDAQGVTKGQVQAAIASDKPSIMIGIPTADLHGAVPARIKHFEKVYKSLENLRTARPEWAVELVININGLGQEAYLVAARDFQRKYSTREIPVTILHMPLGGRVKTERLSGKSNPVNAIVEYARSKEEQPTILGLIDDDVAFTTEDNILSNVQFLLDESRELQSPLLTGSQWKVKPKTEMGRKLWPKEEGGSHSVRGTSMFSFLFAFPPLPSLPINEDLYLKLYFKDGNPPEGKDNRWRVLANMGAPILWSVSGTFWAALWQHRRWQLGDRWVFSLLGGKNRANKQEDFEKRESEKDREKKERHAYWYFFRKVLVNGLVNAELGIRQFLGWPLKTTYWSFTVPRLTKSGSGPEDETRSIDPEERKTLDEKFQVIANYLAVRQVYVPGRETPAEQWREAGDLGSLLKDRKEVLVMILGSWDERTVHEAARVIREIKAAGKDVKVLTSGKYGTKPGMFLDAQGNRLPEAVHYRNILEAEGIHVDFVEPDSTNSGQNIQFSKDKTDKAGFDPDTILVMQNPLLQRRAGLSMVRQYFGKKEAGTAKQKFDASGIRLISYAPYIPDIAAQNDAAFLRDAEYALGELKALREYPKPENGYTIPADIPRSVLDAETFLIPQFERLRREITIRSFKTNYHGQLAALKEYPEPKGVGKILRGMEQKGGRWQGKMFEPGAFGMGHFIPESEKIIQDAQGEFHDFLEGLRRIFGKDGARVEFWEPDERTYHMVLGIFQEHKQLMENFPGELTAEERAGIKALVSDRLRAEPGPAEMLRVGYGITANGGFVMFLWDPSGRIRNLQEFLLKRANDLTGGKVSGRPKNGHVTIGRVFSLPYSEDPKERDRQKREVLEYVRGNALRYEKEWTKNLEEPARRTVRTVSDLSLIQENRWLSARDRDGRLPEVVPLGLPPVKVKVYDREKYGIGLAVVEEAFQPAQGRFHASKAFMDRTRNRDNITTQEVRGGPEDPQKDRKVKASGLLKLWMEQAEALSAKYPELNIAQAVSAFLPNGNLGMNDSFVGIVDGQVYYYRKDNLLERNRSGNLRPYDMLVVMKNGEVGVKSLRFDKKKNRVLDEKGKDIADDIVFGVFGQHIVKGGHEVLKKTAKQFDDLRHLLRFPMLIDEQGGQVHHGFSDGRGELWTERNRERVTRALRGEAVELDMKPVGHIPIERLRNVFRFWGYEDVKGWKTDPQDLRPGEYLILGEKMWIVFKMGIHPHNFFGLTQDGRIFAGAIPGGLTQYVGVTFEELTKAVEKQLQQEKPPAKIQDLFIWGNGKDDFMRWREGRKRGYAVAQGAYGKAYSTFTVFPRSPAARTTEVEKDPALNVEKQETRSEVRQEGVSQEAGNEPFAFEIPGTPTVYSRYEITEEEAYQIVWESMRARLHKPRRSALLPIVHQRLWKPLLASLDFENGSEVRILDVGSGAAFELESCPAHLRKYLWLLDLGEKILRDSGERFPGVRLLRRDWFDTKLPDGSVDAIVGFDELTQLQGQMIGNRYKEFRRILKPGGRMHFLLTLEPYDEFANSITLESFLEDHEAWTKALDLEMSDVFIEKIGLPISQKIPWDLAYGFRVRKAPEPRENIPETAGAVRGDEEPEAIPGDSRSEVREVSAVVEAPVPDIRVERMVRSLQKSTRPATVFVDAEDFGNLSAAQKNECVYAALSGEGIRIVVYNERGQVRDGALEGLMKLDHVTRTGEGLAGAQLRFGRSNAPGIHLSKEIQPSPETVRRLKKRVAFFRARGQSGGTLAAALLWAWSGGENSRMRDINLGQDGFWTVGETLLNALQRSYDATLAFALAA